MEKMTVTKFREMLDSLPGDMAVTIHIDDGCGCCSSGGFYEPANLEIVDGEVRIF